MNYILWVSFKFVIQITAENTSNNVCSSGMLFLKAEQRGFCEKFNLIESIAVGFLNS